MINEPEILDYIEEDEQSCETTTKKLTSTDGGHVSIHSSGFRDFLLKPEILRAITECGFEHPSQVQHECIPQAVLSMDVLCQARGGMGKTAVFVLSTLQQLQPVDGQVSVLVLGHARELAFQICKDYDRFSKYMDIRTACFFGGIPIKQDEEILAKKCPHIVVGTPGRICALVKRGTLNLGHIKHLIVDECDKVIMSEGMRADIQTIFLKTPREKQVMMFSATLSKEAKTTCKKFMQDPLEVLVDSDSDLTLHGLKQHYLKITEDQKNRKLFELLDALDFNQVIVFVKTVQRCIALSELMKDHNFPAMAIHSAMSQEERLSRYDKFKNFESRLLVATNLFGRGIDIEKVNIVINYDIPEDADTYLHRVARAGRFWTKGLAITFVSGQEDAAILNTVQERFEVKISHIPEQIDSDSYIESI